MGIYSEPSIDYSLETTRNVDHKTVYKSIKESNLLFANH